MCIRDSFYTYLRTKPPVDRERRLSQEEGDREEGAEGLELAPREIVSSSL